MTLSLNGLRGLAARHGIVDIDTAAAIAMAESGGNPNAVGDTSIDPQGSVGLWQIFLKAHPEYNGVDLTDPDENAAAMVAISGGGTNWSPWSTYTNGAYRAYMPAVPTNLAGRMVDTVAALPTPIKALAVVGAALAAIKFLPTVKGWVNL